MIKKPGARYLILGTILASGLIVGKEALRLNHISQNDINLPSGTETTPPSNPERHFISSITALNLFGVSREPVAPAPVPENLPETNLRLVLRGVAASSDNSRSSAMIEGSNGKVENYFVGNKVEGAATIDSIHNDRIVLERRGRLETLYFPQSQPQESGPPPPAGISSRTATRGAPVRRQASQQRNSREQLTVLERLNQLRNRSQ